METIDGVTYEVSPYRHGVGYISERGFYLTNVIWPPPEGCLLRLKSPPFTAELLTPATPQPDPAGEGNE